MQHFEIYKVEDGFWGGWEKNIASFIGMTLSDQKSHWLFLLEWSTVIQKKMYIVLKTDTYYYW